MSSQTSLLEKFSTLFLVAGFLFFLVAFIGLGVVPSLMTSEMPEDGGLPENIPTEVKSYFSTTEQYHKALLEGRDIYIKEACWHCHSQYVRPVGSESLYYGSISTPGEYENLMHLPQLFGTRRVGPDLIREASIKSNDWHFAHLYNPRSVVPDSVMPSYTWYFQKKDGKVVPKRGAIALVTYLQSLGEWVAKVKKDPRSYDSITLPPERE